MRFTLLTFTGLAMLCLGTVSGHAQPGKPAPSKGEQKSLGLTFRRNDDVMTGQNQFVKAPENLMATYTVDLGTVSIGSASPPVKLTPKPVNFSPDNFNPDAVAAQLLQEIRTTQELRTKQDWSANRKKIGNNSYWAHVLYPHGSVWPWRWHSNKSNRLGWRRERDDISRFRQQLSRQLAENGRQLGLMPAANTGEAGGSGAGQGPTVNDYDQVPVLASQNLVGRLRRQADSFQNGYYHLVLLDALVNKTLATTAPWLPSQLPTSGNLASSLWEASSSDLLANYKNANSNQLQKLAGPKTSVDEVRKRADALRSKLMKLATRDTSLTGRLGSLYDYRNSASLPEAEDQRLALVRSVLNAYKADSALLKLLVNPKKYSELWGKIDNLNKKLAKNEAPHDTASILKDYVIEGVTAREFMARKNKATTILNEFNTLSKATLKKKPFPEALRIVQHYQAYAKSLVVPTGKSAAEVVAASWQPFKEANTAWVDFNGQVRAAGAVPAYSKADSTRAVQALQLVMAEQQPDEAIKQALAVAVAQLLGRAQPLPETQASLIPNLLYSGQLLLPTQPSRRLARLYIHDRGQGVPSNNRARYAVCLQYSATDGAFEDLPGDLSECQTPTGYVGVSVELAVLERSVFVNQLYDAILVKMNKLATRADAQKKEGSAEALALAKRTEDQVLKELQTSKAVKDAASDAGTSTTNVIIETAEEHSLRESLRDFFDDFVREQGKLSETPRAGTVLVGQRLMVYQRGQFGDVKTGHYFELDSVALEVEDGSAMGIKAYGKYGKRQVLFETYAPLNLSSDYDLRNRWYVQRLFAQSSELLAPEEEQGLFLKLHETMRYYPLLLARTSDRSPANGVYMFHPQDPLSSRILRKDPTSKLLQARVFSDLVGVANDRPNGLLQVELTKKFVLLNRFTNGRLAQFGFLNYVQPTLTVSKIEDNARYLEYRLEPAENGDPYPHDRLVRTIDLLRYANLRLGATQNLLHLKLPSMKSDFSLDYAAILSRVAVRDPQSINGTAARDSTLNVVSYGPQLLWRIRPDSRFGAQLRVAVLMQKLFNDHEDADSLVNARLPYRINRVKEDYGAGPGGHGHTLLGKPFQTTGQTILQVEMMLWANVSENSELFFRTQFSQLRYATYQTYFQMQLGYQFDIFTNRRTAVLPAGVLPK